MSTRISRSTFIKGLAGVGMAVVSGKLLFDFVKAREEIPCRMLGPSREFGHMIRDRLFPKFGAGDSSASARSYKVVIVGGGVAGLSAAWWLRKQGLDDFVLLELEKEVGGNSSSGTNQFGPYPWGAHYIPMANKESTYVHELFRELGVIESTGRNGLPVYNELFLCHDPQERLYKDGSFQEGLVPKRGLQESDEHQLARFFSIVQSLRDAIGSDGKPAFAIPIAGSSQDSEYVSLDRISMADWLKKNGLNSRPLVWFVNYSCRDDYGSNVENVSAWAGIHYFAGRRGRGANAEPNSVVTWPDGNGYVIKRLKESLNEKIRTGTLVTEVTSDDAAVTTSYIDTKTKQPAQVRSQFTIFAAPRFLAKYIVSTDPHTQTLNYDDLTYAPWMVANISVKRIPDARGTGLAWDNVSYYSDSLGYVVASHQDITTRQKPTVITYYFPLSDEEPRAARFKLMTASAREWSRIIIEDLEKMHPDIGKEIISIDLWPWGHGMIRPSVGFIWGETRKRMQQNIGNVYFAHSDMSGISNFEEAQFHGVEAAKQILAKLG